MKVVSLFDGISCAKVALDKVGIPITSYKAAEIDKWAISISKKNHPIIENIGNVKDVSGLEIDLLIGGSPCQDLSIAKKGRKGLEGERSGLFWEYVRILKESNPKYFILENVASMSKKDKDEITSIMGVNPIMINASLVSAQSRKRLFWTNIPQVILPEDRGITVKDILEKDVDEKYYIKNKYTEVNPDGHKIGYVGINDNQGSRVYSINGKSQTLSANGGGGAAKTGLYKIGRDIGRRLNQDGIREDDNKELPIIRRIETREDGKCGTLTHVMKDNLVVSDKIRKLTPIECERLQGLPDNYTFGISDTQRYKCLGNAFNVDVIAHILSFIPKISG